MKTKSNYQFVAIDHVQLAAPENCEDVARKFYGKLLGMKELQKPDILMNQGGLWFQCGTHQIHIGIQKEFCPAKKAHSALLIKNIASFREHLKSHSIPITEGEPLEGINRFFIHDPFENRIEFLEKTK